MNHPDLHRLLRSARLPTASDDARKEFAQAVIKRLRTERPPQFRRRAWRQGAIAVAAALAGLALGFGLWHRSLSSGGPGEALQDGGVLRKLLAQYPGRLQGVVQNESGLHILLSDHAGIVVSDPVWLEIREGQAYRIVVTFSGQQIQCGGRPVMVLSDPGGQIMLIGDGFFWSDQISAGKAAAVQIRAVRIPNQPVADKPSIRL